MCVCVCAGLVKPVLDGLLKRQATGATDAVLLVRYLLSPSPCSCRLSSSFTCKYGPTPTPRVPGTVGPECRRTKPPGAGILVAIWDASAECLKKILIYLLAQCLPFVVSVCVSNCICVCACHSPSSAATWTATPHRCRAPDSAQFALRASRQP